MSFRRNLLIRSCIGDLYEAQLVDEGNTYLLKDSSGLVIDLILIQGNITEFKQFTSKSGQLIHQILINDYSGSIWVHTSDDSFIKDSKLWDLVEIMGSIEFFLNEEEESIELFVKPFNLMSISDENKEILHILDSKKQKSVLPEISNKIKRYSDFKLQDAESGLESDSLENEGEEGDINGDNDDIIETSNSKTGSNDKSSNIEKTILKIIKSEDSGDGVSLETIKKKLESSYSINDNELEDIIFNLQMEGDVFEPTFRKFRVNL